jgi:hypothetical protein
VNRLQGQPMEDLDGLSGAEGLPLSSGHVSGDDEPPPEARPVISTLSPARSCAVRIARWFGVALSFLSVAFAIMTYSGIWNYLRGDTLLTDLAVRLDLSYAQVSRQVRPGDPEWHPLIRIITNYSTVKIPRDRKPVVFARGRAITSAQMEMLGNTSVEWTAPTTPIMLSYKDFTTEPIQASDVIIVGTIQDFHEWVRKDEADFDFVTRNIIFGLLSACVGIFLALRA